MDQERINHILDVIDGGLAAYDEYRRQRDLEDQVVVDGLTLAVKEGLISPATCEDEIRIFHERY